MTQILDISGSVTEEQYISVLNKLLEQFENWRQEKSWCTDIYLAVTPLTLSFRWDRFASGYYHGYDGRMYVEPAFHTDESRGQDLRDVRGRILKYANDRTDVFGLDKANEFLRHSGLPEYVPVGTTKNQFYADLTGMITTELNEEQLKEKLARWMRRNDFTMLGANVYLEHQGQRDCRVPDSDTVNLIPGVGRPYATP